MTYDGVKTNENNTKSTLEDSQGFDAIIVVSSSKEQANFWKERFKHSKLIGKHIKIYSIFEKWEGGAGQLLGTLNAWREVCKKADLDGVIRDGSSIAIYHTAGKGKRIAPLGLAEIDKGAVRLPRLVEYSGKYEAITLLEAVIDQTSIFAKTRKGRISVFWGDGLFIPSKDVFYEGKHHVELFSIRGHAPNTEKEWKSGWENYGFIIPKKAGSIQREKQSWEEFSSLVEKGVIKQSEHGEIIIGRSLGCFSVSYAFFKALLEEYEPELLKKTEKLDTDPHLWMPLTSSKEDFKNEDLWGRINRFKQNFLKKDTSNLSLFGDKDLGFGTFWWDFGQLQLYHKNLLKLLEDSVEGEKMRALFRAEKYLVKNEKSEDFEVNNSIFINSEVKGKVENCILVNSTSGFIKARNSVIFNSQIRRAELNQSIVYNLTDSGEIKLKKETITDLFHPKEGKIRIRTKNDRDGKADWNRKIHPNRYSYAEVESLMKDES